MKRLLYPDICKFIAIFLVTCSHCAQYISGRTWTNFFFGTHLDIAFNMPLFMMISGWFINLDKMRGQKPLDFIISKFKRLMIPAIVWWLVLWLVSKPESSPVSFYWYLSALFVCMCIIYIFAKFIKNDYICILVTIIFVLICPKTEYVHINFMLPFLWAGAGVNRVFKTRYAKPFFFVSLIMAIVLSFFWDINYTIYRSPWNILQIDSRMVFIYVYRFCIGLTWSSVIIYIVKMFEGQLAFTARLGGYSLAVYTGSFVINALVALLLCHIGYHTNQMFIIDLLSLGLCVVIYTLIILFSNLCRKNKVTSLLFLGE